MNHVEVPTDIAADEELGRRVSSERNARRAQRSRVPFHEFLAAAGETRIYVDRLAIAPPDEAVAIAENRDRARNRAFYGWAVLSASDAGGNGRRVAASPVPGENPYHADIALPQSAAKDREEQKRHAQELADSSHWRGK